MRKMRKKLWFWIQEKPALFSAVLQEIRVVQRWILLWRIGFPALIRVESVLVKDSQVINSAGLELKPHWTALVASESEPIRVARPWDFNLGNSRLIPYENINQVSKKLAKWYFMWSRTSAEQILRDEYKYHAKMLNWRWIEGCYF